MSRLLRRDVMNLGRLGRARALAAQQSCPPLGDKVIDVVDGEREHGRSLLVEFAARGTLGEPLDRAVDACAYGIEIGRGLSLFYGGDHFSYSREESRLLLVLAESQEAQHDQEPRAEGAEQHRPVKEPIPVPLHQARLFTAVIDLRTRMERIDRILFGARRLD